jgi:hypothetical protein
MPNPSEDEDLLQVPGPAEQARVRGAIKSNLNMLSPLMRQKHLEDTRRQADVAGQYGLGADKAYQRRVSIEMGAQGIVDAGGQRKGGYVSLESGAAGIIAAGGQKTGDHVTIGMGAAGIIGQNRAYLRKKRGVGALAGARYGSPEMFPGKFPHIVGRPVSVGFGRSAGGVNLNILAAGQSGFANLT